MTAPLDVEGMSADQADELLARMRVAVGDWAEVVSAKRLAEDPDAPRAPEWRLANPQVDPEAQAIFDVVKAGRDAAANANGSASDDAPPWVPAEPRMCLWT
jgi:hypothetical protein